MRDQKYYKKLTISAIPWLTLIVLVACGIAAPQTNILYGMQVGVATAKAAPRAPFTKDEITQLLKLDTPDALLIPEIRAMGINFAATPEDMNTFAKLGASHVVLGVIGEASNDRKIAMKAEEEAHTAPASGAPVGSSLSIEERARRMAEPYKKDGYQVASIISIREGPEDAIIGIRGQGEYFKAGISDWSPLSPQELSDLTQEVKTDLQRPIDHPLVWFINREHLMDVDFDVKYKGLLNSVRKALFGGVQRSVMVTLIDMRIPPSALFDSNQHLIPSKLASCSLDKDHCRATRTINKLDNPNADVLNIYFAAVRDYFGANYNTAAALFKRVVEAYPQDERASSAQFYRGEIACQQHDYTNAVDVNSIVLLKV